MPLFTSRTTDTPTGGTTAASDATDVEHTQPLHVPPGSAAADAPSGPAAPAAPAGLRPPGADRSDVRDPDAPVGRRSPWFVLRLVGRELRDDRGGDLAAGLTFRALLALVWASLALGSGLALLGRSTSVLDRVERVLGQAVATDVAGRLTTPLRDLGDLPGLVVVVAVAAAGLLWAVVAYVAAAARVANLVHEVDEGRPAWRLWPTQLLLALVVAVLASAGVVVLAVTGPVARAVGAELGLGEGAVTAWEVAKWPVLALVVLAAVVLLQRSTPNAVLPRRLLTPGSVLAFLAWLVLGVAAAAAVAATTRVDAGPTRLLAVAVGVLAVLLWVWLSHVALVLGGELDAELERGRQLQHGVAAEERLQLPLRDERGVRRAEARRERDHAAQREIRVAAAGHGDPADRPFGRPGSAAPGR